MFSTKSTPLSKVNSIQMSKIRNAPIGVQTTAERLLGMIHVDAATGTATNYGTVAKPITVVVVSNAIDAHKVELDDYNSGKKLLANKLIKLKKSEKAITEMGVRVLAGGKSFFSPDGEEVQILGGTRTSDRKSPKKKPVVDIASNIKKAS